MVFSCDHKVLVEHLFELLDFFELEFVISVALVEMQWPLCVEKCIPCILYGCGGVWEFVGSEPLGDGFYALLLVDGFGQVKGRFGTEL